MVGIESGIFNLDVMDQIVYIYDDKKLCIFYKLAFAVDLTYMLAHVDTCVHYMCFRITKEVVGYIYHRHLTVYTYM